MSFRQYSSVYIMFICVCVCVSLMNLAMTGYIILLLPMCLGEFLGSDDLTRTIISMKKYTQWCKYFMCEKWTWTIPGEMIAIYIIIIRNTKKARSSAIIGEPFRWFVFLL